MGCFLSSREQYDSLPDLPLTAPAFAGDFPVLLLELCAHGYSLGEAKPPVSLPRWSTVAEYYQRLFGISLVFDDENLQPFASELLKSVRSPNAALARRGPIWAAVTIWSTIRRKWAVAYGLMLRKDPYANEEPYESECDGQLRIRLQVLRVIEANFASMQQAWQTLGKPPLEFDSKLEHDDILFVEKVVMRVWLHNLAFIPTSQQEISPEFAYEIVSGKGLIQKANGYVHWGWLQENLEPTPPEGEDYAGLCAIYPNLQQEMGERPTDVPLYCPDDLTYVSSEAVKQVFLVALVLLVQQLFPLVA